MEKRKTRTVTISIDDSEWLEFKAKYPHRGMSRQLRKLILLDLEGKLDNA
jgi:hypothetical protein